MVAPTLPTTVTLKWDGRIGLFEVVEPLVCFYGPVDDRGFRKSIAVPAGFETDLASIPRRLRGIIGQIGKHIQAAIVHDYAYSGNTTLTKREADQLFLDCMKASGVWLGKRWIMYWAVRANVNGGYWGK